MYSKAVKTRNMLIVLCSFSTQNYLYRVLKDIELILVCLLVMSISLFLISLVFNLILVTKQCQAYY